VDNKSDGPMYEWIRKNDPAVVMKIYESLALYFPQGPCKGVGLQVDMVVITPESAS
jgi:hypothetical protein